MKIIIDYPIKAELKTQKFLPTSKKEQNGFKKPFGERI
jgi:hypothetical protein